MQPALLILLLCQTQVQLNAQKKWDGGGGDSLWNNPLNWYPDGIPLATDTVVLDNQWVASAYSIFLPEGTIGIQLFSLAIQPKKDVEIVLYLPSTNTASPALQISSSDTAIYIGEGATLNNSSGAAAGNAITISGKFYIANGGRYVHQTLRGNAALIANLVTNATTQTGIFEFNVPGNSAYTISASGRNFGSLLLNGQNSSRKTYTASGSNKLTIAGDLTINDQAVLSSSLTQNIIVNGNLVIKGRLSLNPLSGDTAGRCLETNGVNKTIEVSGQFNQGIHFRKWIISGRYRLSNTLVNLDHPAGVVHVTSGSDIDMGTSRLKGAGALIADSNTHWFSSAASIMGNDSLSNIQLPQLHVAEKISFTCYGNKAQTTGENFPTIINKLTIEKTAGELKLTQSLAISDSLILKKGMISMSDSSAITIHGYCDSGNLVSFVHGKIIQLSNDTLLHFPLGIDDYFTPVLLKKITNDTLHYAMRSIRFDAGKSQLPIPAAIDSLDLNNYWVVEVVNTNQVNETIQFNFLKPLAFDAIVLLNSNSQAWQLPEAPATRITPHSLTAQLTFRTKQVIALAKLKPTVLPLSSITLEKIIDREKIMLRWIADDDTNVIYYLVEQSCNRTASTTLDTIPSLRIQGAAVYTTTVNKTCPKGCFFSITGIDFDGRLVKSNLIYITSQITKTSLYPNPASNRLFIESASSIVQTYVVHPNGRVSKVTYITGTKRKEVSIIDLKPGNYYLVIDQVNGSETIPFTKQVPR